MKSIRFQKFHSYVYADGMRYFNSYFLNCLWSISLYLFFCHNLSIFYHKENGFVCAVLFILGRQMFVGLTVFKCNLKHIHTMMYNIFLIYDTQTTFVVLFYLTHNSPVLSYKKWFCYIIHKIVLFYYTQKSLVVSKTK